MGAAFAGSDWAVFQGASGAVIPFMGLARASNAERWPKRFQPGGLHSSFVKGQHLMAVEFLYFQLNFILSLKE